MQRAGSDGNLSGKPKVPSEKHDILFSKARYVLNQRHIKRPWFHLNPFLEKTDENIDLENFLPEESKYIQPLESLVLCESFHIDNPVETREMSIDNFFEYLFSSEWDKGCCVRILEGQLLDQLLLGLYRLETEGTAVRHTTYAFAKNNRPRTGCYKLSDKGSAGSVEETLLIEFAHYGRLIKEKPNENTLTAFEHLEHDQVGSTDFEEETANGKSITLLPVLTEMTYKRRDKTMSDRNTKAAPSSDMPKWGPRGSLMSKHVNALSFLKAIQTDNKSRSSETQFPFQQNKRHSIVPTQTANRSKPVSGVLPLCEGRRKTLRGPSLLSGNRRHPRAVSQTTLDKSQHTFKLLQKRQESTIQQRQDDTGVLKNTNSTFKKKYRGSFNSIDFDEDFYSEPGDINEHNEEEEPFEERDEYFGEEFYLSDQKENNLKHIKSIKQILHEKKIDLHERREEAKRQREEKEKNVKICILPELPKLKNEDLEAFMMHNETIKMPDELPTLEEFIKLLKSDEYYDPRYKNKVREKKRKIAKRYYTSRGMHSSSIMLNTGSIPDETTNISTFRRGASKKLNAQVTKQKDSPERKSKVSILLTQQESVTFRKNTPQQLDIKGTDSVSSILERGQEVLGVTDSEPCKDHFVKGKIPSIIENKEKEKDKEDSIPSLKSPIFPRIRTPSENDTELSDTDSNESSSSENFEELFDTNKLNTKYSVERLRKKRRSKGKKRGGFIEVLAKYYNMQNTLKVFSKSSACRGIKKGRLSAKTFGSKKLQGKQNKEEASVIGKLKKFKFLDVRNKKKMNFDNLPQADFSIPSLAEFHQHLNDALDKFVVRQEIVVSNLNTFYNATTSVTFTKTSCFQHKERYIH